MKKLFKLKEWLTVPDAARHLTILLSEEVTQPDVLRLGLDGHLKLSVQFVNHARAKRAEKVSIGQARWVEIDVNGKTHRVISGIDLGNGQVLNVDSDVVMIEGGIWDLPLFGNEQLDVEHAYQQLTGGPAVALSTLGGAFIADPEGRLWQLQDSFEPGELGLKKDGTPSERSFYPAAALPSHAVFVVRTSALTEFERSLRGADRGLSTKEYHSLYKLILGIAVEKYHYDPNKNNSAANRIASHLQKHGLPLDEDSVRKKLELAVQELAWQKDSGNPNSTI